MLADVGQVWAEFVAGGGLRAGALLGLVESWIGGQAGVRQVIGRSDVRRARAAVVTARHVRAIPARGRFPNRPYTNRPDGRGRR